LGYAVETINSFSTSWSRTDFTAQQTKKRALAGTVRAKHRPMFTGAQHPTHVTQNGFAVQRHIHLAQFD
jgi:hypothetical protein